MGAFLYGMGTSFSLIVAIGAQNAFVLKQGLKKQYVFWICLLCALSDSILISLGVTGISTITTLYPLALQIAQYGGALFLFIYGCQHMYAALFNKMALTPSQIEKDSLGKIILLCLTLTWLNPHVYIDTFVLIGSISGQFPDQRLQFTLGAILVSWLFFFGLGYGARVLAPLFKQSIAWKILDMLVAVIMWTIAWSLLHLTFL